ncbi:c-type cytochrome [Echinimonas agarilytica]|uniref:Cytochrome c4 n=1 Tax=Echinimonas agarilytica TaxID=1215918 RepID=A0AA41W3T0_9GAMM|nr:c-type cytochrome [Echinimonas agarilytica]MCM2678286.1 cytochrome c4 [Echinimonas agarilytica]
MNRIILACIMGLLASTSASALEPAEVEQAAMGCAACHGQNGQAIMDAYPNLAGQHSKYIAKQLREFKSAIMGGEGRANAVMGGMAMPLTEEMMDALAEHYSNMPAQAGSTPESVIEVAQPLYLGGDIERKIAACVACHGPRGNGTELSGFPKISGQNAEYIKLQLTAFRSGERANDLNGMMRDVAQKLTDDEIDALSKYLGGLH